MVFEKLFHAAIATARTPATAGTTSSKKNKKTKKNDIHPSLSISTTTSPTKDIQDQQHAPKKLLSKDETISSTTTNNNNNNSVLRKNNNSSIISSNNKKTENTNEINSNKNNTPISRSQKRKRNQNTSNNTFEHQPTTNNSVDSTNVNGDGQRNHNDKHYNNTNTTTANNKNRYDKEHDRNQSYRQDRDSNSSNNTSNRHKERSANSTSTNNNNINNNNFKKQKRQFVSPLAIELSIVLKDLSQQKKLQELLSLYWNKPSDTTNTNATNTTNMTSIDNNKYSTAIRDNHHACVVIDCCSRCGDMTSAERIYDQLVYNNKQNNNGSSNNSSTDNSSSSISIEIYTALLKGYAHSGNVIKMMKLFSSLNTTNTTTPNVRTINTVLRGCLWTPAIGNTNDSISSSSSSSSSKQKQSMMIVGGVVSSEELWHCYQLKQKQEQEQQTQLSISSFFDVSSYEYSISLLCQALCTTVAQERINDFQKLYNVTIRGKATVVLLPSNSTNDNNDNENNSSILEVIAICYLALGRAYSILGDDTAMWMAVQRSLSAVRSSRTLLSESTQTVDAATTNKNNNNNSSANHADQDVTTVPSKYNKKQKKNDTMAVGGKRSWKNSNTTASDQQQHQQQQYDQSTTTRYNSNYAYRMHRLSEIESDAMLLIKSRTTIKNLNQTDVVTCYMNNLLCFNGGGSTTLQPVVDNKNTNNNNNNNNSTTTTNDNNKNSSKSNNLNQSEDAGVLIPTIYSFGLAKLVKVDIFDSANKVILDMEEIINKVSSMYNIPCESPVDTNGCLQLDKIYKDSKLPLDIELGAGFGSWIVSQAQNNSNRNYLAIELRSDRVYQILARAIIQFHGKLNNLCIVGCDSYSFFHRRRVSNQSVTTIFINHPEPPTQTYGDNMKQLQLISTVGSNTEANNQNNNVEPSHMLHSSTIVEMIPCLKVDGKIVVVTDNKSYVRLLAATFSKVILLQQQRQQQPEQNEHKSRQKKQQRKVMNSKVQIRSMKINEVNNFNTTLRLLETFGRNVNIFQGEQHPVTCNIVATTTREGISNTVVGTSYFDRLWRTGVSSHSERLNRFILVFIREK